MLHTTSALALHLFRRVTKVRPHHTSFVHVLIRTQTRTHISSSIQSMDEIVCVVLSVYLDMEFMQFTPKWNFSSLVGRHPPSLKLNEMEKKVFRFSTSESLYHFLRQLHHRRDRCRRFFCSFFAGWQLQLDNNNWVRQQNFNVTLCLWMWMWSGWIDLFRTLTKREINVRLHSSTTFARTHTLTYHMIHEWIFSLSSLFIIINHHSQ